VDPYTLSVQTEADSPVSRNPAAICWYRTRLKPGELKDLHRRSDPKAFVQTVGYLAVLGTTIAASLYSAQRWPWWMTVMLIFLNGMGFAFLINGVHELGHGTVFKTKALNEFFVRVLSFFGWINFQMFQESHMRHHRYTLHPPDDLEVVLPVRVLLKSFLTQGFVNPVWFWNTLKTTCRIARGKFEGEWEHALYDDNPEAGYAAIIWARTLLIGHTLIVFISLYFQWWLAPVLITLAPFYGQWLFLLCNSTQHIGLQDNVNDFRLCCRTFTLNPIVRFMYWQMNYHIEHHMYAAVPCYNLGKLHRAIKSDLPPCQHGLVATWKEIAAIQRKQEADPSYQYIPPIPKPSVV